MFTGIDSEQGGADVPANECHAGSIFCRTTVMTNSDGPDISDGTHISLEGTDGHPSPDHSDA